jgi:hypothetical protein
MATAQIARKIFVGNASHFTEKINFVDIIPF